VVSDSETVMTAKRRVERAGGGDTYEEGESIEMGGKVDGGMMS
jgi:hypothetical protein